MIKLLEPNIGTYLYGMTICFSILDCYEAEFGPIELAREGRGVPLEHLLTCVQGVEIGYGENGMKRVQWHERSYDHSKKLVNLEISKDVRVFRD